MKTCLIWICLLYCSQGCVWDPPYDDKLKLINASSEPVLIFYNVEGTNHTINGLSPDYNPFYEIQRADTTRGYQLGLTEDSPQYMVPGGTTQAHLGPGQWEGHIGNGKLWIYVFKPETVMKYDWNTILKDQKWIRVYALTLDQVEYRNWVVSL